MVSGDLSRTREIFESVLYIAIIIVSIIIASFVGFALQGFEENFFTGTINLNTYLGSFILYYILLLPALALIIFPIMKNRLIRRGEHPATQEGSFWLTRMFSVSYIYNPEHGLIGYLWRKKGGKFLKGATSIIRVIFIFLIFFGMLGVLQLFFPTLNISGIPSQPQQITLVADVTFGSLLPAVAENGTILFILFMLLGLTAHFISKTNLNRDMKLIVFFMLAILLISPFVGAIWMGYHSIVYGNDSASLFATWLFGTLGSMITIITGIFIPFFIWHFINNLIVKLLEVITIAEDVALISGLFLIVILFLYIIFEVRMSKKRKLSKEERMIS